MKESVYLQCVRVCDESINGQFPLKEEDAAALGVRFASLSSLRSQMFTRRVRRLDHIHKARRGLYRQQYEDGMHICAVARQPHVRHSPYLLSRLLVEDLCPRDRRVAEYMRDTRLIADARLRSEVEEAMRADTDCSILIDEARAAAGASHERMLERELRGRGICFETEGDLRARGAYRTPDARLLVPVAVRSAETCKWHVVNWIDSKAMFGDPETFRRDHFAQLVSYVNRYGPGMVIYWLDLAESLNGEATPPQHRHADILAVAAFPDVVALPEDEPPGAWDAAMERWAA